ncbi:MAG: ABC transporter substrate-binding protein [Zetaproteobacteria bacterium CG12_big_fil_rev_8_21_14_0_65_54_13]|nr:MAG: ABC transporter substrate-binding protein [Zetaproteobacteria bacterium CG12_big_fil_rev_8_21_14_0_65_54_13]PIX54767.1 MAG: ABC transporter substrate-binding protein [Zetaproteobacteria bacterium CG_4_10_14_3_um_filter_54_28]PJA29677.1 MAG: ABC transporter substrate-binding protein [Zetaproteobacteria bacterium CG_4_9_14_3_um_filter_54_145]
MKLLLALLTCLLLMACHGQQREQGLLCVGLAQMPVTLDPRFATDAASTRVQELLHRGLLRLDEHFHLQGDLAVSWQHSGPLLWRFRLKPGLHFSDGSALTAADVVATLSAVLDPQLTSPLRAGFAAVARVEAEGSDVVAIHLHHPDASLLPRLNIGILPKALAVAPQQARSTTGCGAYRLRVWNQHGLTLERVDAHAAVPLIQFASVKDPVTRLLKLSRGELDFIQNDLPAELLPYLRQQPTLTIRTRPSTTFSYIGLNLQDERLAALDVRRALALALDRNKLKEALFADLPVLAETVLAPGHWAATPLPATPFDAHQAEALLDRAGMKRAANGMRFSLNYRTSTDPARLRLATAIAAMWRQIGIDVHIESLEWGGFYARIKQGDFQVFSLSWVGISDPDIYRWILHSSMWPPHGSNRGRYANSRMDQWLDRAAATADQSQRKLLYAQAERQMQADMVYIPLWYDPVIAVYGPRIGNFIPRADGSLLGLAHVQLLD